MTLSVVMSDHRRVHPDVGYSASRFIVKISSVWIGSPLILRVGRVSQIQTSKYMQLEVGGREENGWDLRTGAEPDPVGLVLSLLIVLTLRLSSICKPLLPHSTPQYRCHAFLYVAMIRACIVCPNPQGNTLKTWNRFSLGAVCS